MSRPEKGTPIRWATPTYKRLIRMEFSDEVRNEANVLSGDAMRDIAFDYISLAIADGESSYELARDNLIVELEVSEDVLVCFWQQGG